MGITSFDIELLDKYTIGVNSVCELGAQNLYDKEYPSYPVWPYANEYYEARGIKYTCIDLSEENNCLVHDLSKPLPIKEKFDMVTNFGTSEHVRDLYECLKNIHNLTKKSGIIICENPKIDNWPGHGFHYMTQAFYIDLAKLCGYTILEIGEHPAMGNITDGWNVFCVMRKGEDKFCTKAQFEKLDFRKE
jgi:SAM-dependent methyltransferase